MKRIINSILILFVACTVFTGCIKEEYNPSEGRATDFIPVDILKRLYKGTDLVLNAVNLSGATSINGVIISDAAGKNIAPGRVVIQNFGRGTVRGITLEMESGNTDLVTGDSVSVMISGTTLSITDGAYLLKGIKSTGVKRLGSNVAVTPIPVTIGSLVSGFSTYEGTLVKFTGELKNNPLPGEKMSGNKQLSVGVATGIYLSTLPTAAFADSLLPGKAVITGIPMVMKTDTGNVYVVAPRTFNDVEAINSVVLAAWQFGSPASTGIEPGYQATTVTNNLDTPVLVRGAGLLPTGLVRGFSSNTPVVQIITKDDALNLGGYLEFAMKSKPGYTLSLDLIQARTRRSAAGANKYRWAYRLNDGEFKEIGSADVSFTSTVDGVDQTPVALGGISELKDVPAGTNVTFRLYTWGFTSLTGTFAIGRYAAGDKTNSLAITGTIDKE